MIVLDLSILNQKGTPMFNSDTFANRPAFGIVGRIFISIDTAAIYRDTGTAWDLIADGGSSSTNIYNSNGTLSANRVVSSGGFSLTFNPSTTFDTTLTAAINTSSLASFSVNRLSYAAAFSSNDIGNLFGGSSSFNLQTFAGSATFANSNIAANSSINSVDFSTGGSTITMTQATGLRVMAGHINMFQYQGTNSGTITHAAVSQNLGFYRPTAATGILTITNAYGHLINALDDYGAGFTFTNRWGIYQAGASDNNYFAANIGVGQLPANWVTSKAIQVVNGSISSNSINNTAFSSNVYFDGTNVRYLNTGTATSYNQENGTHQFNTAISGSANSIVTYQRIMTFDTNANVGIGVMSPTTRTTIQGNSSNIVTISGTTTIERILNLLPSSNVGNLTFGIDTITGNSYLLSFYNGADLIFATRNGGLNTEAARITATGNLLVGTNVDAGQKLQVIGSVKFSAGINDFESDSPTNYCLKLRNINANSYGLFIQSASTPNSGFPLINITDSTAATSYFRVDSGTGNVGINTSPGTQKLYLNGSLRIDGQTSGSAGGSSGQHLIINCDGTSYKIALLNT